jgi:hypothetical protein
MTVGTALAECHPHRLTQIPMKPVALIIRDGWGISPKGLAAAKQEGNAPLLAKLPFHEYLYKTYPQSRLSASGCLRARWATAKSAT